MKKEYKIITAVFVVLILAACVVLTAFKIPQRGIGKIKSVLNKEVSVYEEKIDIEALNEEFTIFFIADSHICLCDDRDSEVKDICDSRYKEFVRDSKGSEKNFSIVMDYVRKQNPDLVIFGGDIADEATYASIEYIKKEVDKLDCPYLFCMGNHDFAYGNEYFSDRAYEDYFIRYDELNEVKEGCQIKRFDDFSILLLDDVNNQVCDETTAAVEELKNEGKDVIVAQHVPIVPKYGSDLVEMTKKAWGEDSEGNSRVLMGTSGIYPVGATADLIGFESDDEGPVRAVLAGHVHFAHSDRINGNASQVIAKPAFERGLIKVTLY